MAAFETEQFLHTGRTPLRMELLAELSGVTKRFGKLTALDALDLKVRPGELLALLGPNGAGKTTAISLLLGLQRPDGGKASLFGISPENIGARRHIGVMMQEAALAPELRVREQIDLVASYYPAPLTPDEAMDVTHTRALANRPYGKLSGGQKRQVQFALAVCGRPKLLFLDEPTVGLDVEARELMWTSLRRLVDRGASILLTTHYIEEAEALADRVVVIAKGREVASGSVNEMRSLVVRSRITCVTSLEPVEVETWPGVGSVSRIERKLSITATNPEAVVRRLLAADEELEELEVRRAGLAEVFTELTQSQEAA
jgi:ABC-2 type transport system ATP-binding protein